MIFALATPVAQSALAIFRISGKGCLNVFNSVLSKPINNYREVSLRTISFGGVLIDHCSVVFYKGPKSFTGEDSIEVFCHGGLPVIRGLTSVFLNLGFEEAAPGEFSKRAFENEKISLNEAEAIADLIHSEDEEKSKLSAAVVSGRLNELVMSVGDELNALRVFVEGSIDFSDEDYNFIKEGEVEFRLEGLRGRINTIVDSSLVSSKQLAKNRVLFFGPPNTGKSSLFNRLLGSDRALVSNIPGTTRDLIDSEMFYNSVNLELVDSAGVRDTDDLVESQGVALSRSEVEEANVVLVVLDKNTEQLADSFRNILDGKKNLFIFNKSDESFPVGNFDCVVSAKSGDGIQVLKDKILPLVRSGFVESTKTFLIRDRHLVLFEGALAHIENCIEKIKLESDVDIAAEDLRLARSCLDEFLGVKFPDALLGDIFKDFCIGK